MLRKIGGRALTLAGNSAHAFSVKQLLLCFFWNFRHQKFSACLSGYRPALTIMITDITPTQLADLRARLAELGDSL